MKRATPATISSTHRYLAFGYLFFKSVTPRSMTTGKKENGKFRNLRTLISLLLGAKNRLMGEKYVREGRPTEDKRRVWYEVGTLIEPTEQQG